MGHDDDDADGPEAGAEARGRHNADTSASAADAREATSDIRDGDSPECDRDGAPGTQQLAEAEKAEVEAVEEILEGEFDEATIARIVTSEHWHGPLPHPSALAAFERILSGAADRVPAMAERELALREARELTVRAAVDGQVTIETITAQADRDALKRGQFLATGISALVSILSFAGMFLTPWAAVGFAVPLSQVATALIRTVSDGLRVRGDPESDHEVSDA